MGWWFLPPRGPLILGAAAPQDPSEAEGCHMDPKDSCNTSSMHHLNPGLAFPTMEMRGSLFISLQHWPTQTFAWGFSSLGKVTWSLQWVPILPAVGYPRLSLSQGHTGRKLPLSWHGRSCRRCTWEEKRFAGGRKQDLIHKQHPQWLSAWAALSRACFWAVVEPRSKEQLKQDSRSPQSPGDGAVLLLLAVIQPSKDKYCRSRG